MIQFWNLSKAQSKLEQKDKRSLKKEVSNLLPDIISLLIHNRSTSQPHFFSFDRLIYSINL